MSDNQSMSMMEDVQRVQSPAVETIKREESVTSQPAPTTPMHSPSPAVSSLPTHMSTSTKKESKFVSHEDNTTPRSYLDATVVPTLLEGMKLLASERPADPLAYLGNFLLSRSNEGKQQK